MNTRKRRKEQREQNDKRKRFLRREWLDEMRNTTPLSRYVPLKSWLGRRQEIKRRRQIAQESRRRNRP